MKNAKLTRRISLGTLLGILAGVLCFAGFASNTDMPTDMAQWQVWSWSNGMMWSTIINRMVLGQVVALAGFMMFHPIFGFRLSPWLRGMKVGFLISLPMAVGALMNSDPQAAKAGFWIVLVMGTIIGLIIDVVITKFSGEGEELM